MQNSSQQQELFWSDTQLTDTVKIIQTVLLLGLD